MGLNRISSHRISSHGVPPAAAVWDVTTSLSTPATLPGKRLVKAFQEKQPNSTPGVHKQLLVSNATSHAAQSSIAQSSSQFSCVPKHQLCIKPLNHPCVLPAVSPVHFVGRCLPDGDVFMSTKDDSQAAEPYLVVAGRGAYGPNTRAAGF